MAFLVPVRSPSFLSGALMVAGATALLAFGYRELSPGAQHARYAHAEPYAPELDPPAPVGVATGSGKVQLAILLDTSSSMSGLIDQARSQLWRIVNELGRARRDGGAPALEIAVYEYGNSGLNPLGGYIRQVSPFSDDLDAVSEALFSLTTSGGSEHAGQVIARAHRELDWDPAPDALRLVYIAGNETFAQGPVDYREAIGATKADGILVNTIHCGDEGQGAHDLWADAAALAGGRYLAIDHNAVVQHIAAPQDEAIARLGRALNETYLYYGGAGKDAWENQVRQDDNAAGYGLGSSIQRAVSKSGRMYNNAGWDLVDGLREGRVDITEVDKRTLAPELRGLSDAELEARVEAKKTERTRIQAEIAKLEAERRAFIERAREATKSPAAKTLDDAIVESLREQAAPLGYDFD